MAETRRIMRRTPAPANGVSKKAAPRAVALDEEHDEPSPMSQHPSMGDEAEIRGGWGASQEVIDSTSNYAQTFRPTKDTQIIKFLDAKPYAAFRRHWVDRVGIGKRAYTCYQSLGQDCPLCDIGDKPGAVSAFNVALMADDGQPVLKSWECGVKLTQQLKTYHNDRKIGPLDKRQLYFAVSKTESGQRQQVVTICNPVRERDLLEDWSTPPLTEADLERMNGVKYSPEIVTTNTRSEMEEVAAEMTGMTKPDSADKNSWD